MGSEAPVSKLNHVIFSALFGIVIAGGISTSACGDEASQIAIGYATMAPDRTVTLHLRRTTDGVKVTADLVYAPTDLHYADVIAHIGAIAPGQRKLVMPWPDELEK
jgi:hypothetical protein